ncbi:MAG: hypothetical protein ACTSSG_05950 [Candidatus Heimdallarchaeaceae archaeon]
MSEDEVKSLINSVNMVKNMVESIVSAVQERFKDYDNVVVSLKERIEKLETSTSGASQSVGMDTTELMGKINQLEKRIDSLNERILLIEATKSVSEKPKIDIGETSVIKDLVKKETQVPVVETAKPVPVAEKTPPPTPRIVSEAPVPKPTTEAPVPKPTTEAPVPKPTTEAPVPKPTTEPTVPISSIPAPKPSLEPKTGISVSKPVEEIPKAPPVEKPVTQVTETIERDVSPISKEVSGTIPVPPAQAKPVVEKPGAQPLIEKKEEEALAPEEGKSAELFGEAVSGDKAELLKALKKLEDL